MSETQRYIVYSFVGGLLSDTTEGFEAGFSLVGINPARAAFLAEVRS